jgi:NRPS condensation-like uncharacterized protein
MPSRCTTRVKLDAACRIGRGCLAVGNLGPASIFQTTAVPPAPTFDGYAESQFNPGPLSLQETLIQADPIDRPLDPGEAFFFLADRSSCMNFVLFAERRGHLDVERIRAGLAVLQQENPLLRARIVWTAEEGLRFQSAPGLPIMLECRQTSSDGWQAWIEHELGRPFESNQAPLLRCQYLHWSSPDRSVLALTFHHAIGDGRSGAELLRHLLDIMATDAAATPRAAIDPLPAMYEVFPHRFRWSEQPDTADQVADRMMADYKRHGRVGRLPWLAGTELSATTRAPRFIRFTVPPEAVRRLLALSRQHDASLHGVLCAAQLLAQYRLQASGQKEALFLSCPVDMRPYLEPIQPAAPTGLYVTLISASFAVEPSTDLWQLAREVVLQTRLQLARGEGHLFFSLYGLDQVPLVPDNEARFMKALLASLNHTMVSNIGRVPAVESDPDVEAISFALCPMPYQLLFSAVSTYRDSLIVNVNFDAGKLDEPTASALADAMRRILVAASEASAVR